MNLDLYAWLVKLNLADFAESFIAEGWQGKNFLELSREDFWIKKLSKLLSNRDYKSWKSVIKKLHLK